MASKIVNLNWADVQYQARKVALWICEAFPYQSTIALYGIPRGGIPAMFLVSAELQKLRKGIIYCMRPDECDVIVDDLFDSGNTIGRYKDYNKPAYFLYDKRIEYQEQWLVFPWELVNKEIGPFDAVIRLLEYIGENPSREGLQDTPKRVIKSYDELFSGYNQDPASLMTVFKNDTCDEMVVLKGIEFTSCCEHHMLPFVGVAHIAYVPNGKVIGVSKLARLLEIYSRRLQIQERLCQQVTRALDEHLQPLGSACVLEAKHMCMSCRGVKKQNSEMVTSSLSGVFRTSLNTRQEFFRHIKG